MYSNSTFVFSHSLRWFNNPPSDKHTFVFAGSLPWHFASSLGTTQQNMQNYIMHWHRVTLCFGTVSLSLPFSVATHANILMYDSCSCLNKHGCVGELSICKHVQIFSKVLTKSQNHVTAIQMICPDFISNFSESLRNNVASTFAWEKVFTLTPFLFLFPIPLFLPLHAHSFDSHRPVQQYHRDRGCWLVQRHHRPRSHTDRSKQQVPPIPGPHEMWQGNKA